MINGKIIDTSIWINYFNSLNDEKAELVNRSIDADEIIALPVILQETLQGIRENKILSLPEN